MHIWILDHYSSEPKYGGISRQYDFAKEFSRRGIKVTVISSAFSHYSHEYITDEECLYSQIDDNAWYAYIHTTKYQNNGGISRIWNTFSYVYYVWKNFKSIAEKLGKPDVVVGSSVHPFTWLVANHIARKYSVKFIVEVRDLWPANQIDDEGMSPYHPMAITLGILEKWAYGKASKIIYSMPKGWTYICGKLGIPQGKTMWIPQPMDCERFDKNATRYDELDNELKAFVGDDFVCVFTGYYMEYEGVLEMLQAAKIIKDKGLDIKFVFLGSGAEKEHMLEYKHNNSLDNVYIGGRISKELVPAILRRAQICMAHLAVRDNPKSYQYDVSKNKLSEYMYSDSCVIFGTYIENQFVKTSGAGYTIEPFSAEAFANTIEKIYAMDEITRAEFGQNGRKYINENARVEKLVEKYIGLINE